MSSKLSYLFCLYRYQHGDLTSAVFRGLPAWRSFISASFMVEFSGIPQSKSKHDGKKIVEMIARLGKFKGFNPDMIDMAHFVSEKENAPLIVTFTRKADRQQFYKQKSLLKNIHINQLITDDETYQQGDAEVRAPNTYIYLNESLTKMNRDLIIKCKKQSKLLNYKYQGYTVKGQVRVKKTDNSEFIPIMCEDDLHKIK